MHFAMGKGDSDLATLTETRSRVEIGPYVHSETLYVGLGDDSQALDPVDSGHEV